MTAPMKEKKAYWIGGTITAFLGVALIRLLAPELAGAPASIALAAGFVLVTAGITTLACATRRKRSEAFVAVEAKVSGSGVRAPSDIGR
jgi:hypothetical protein